MLAWAFVAPLVLGIALLTAGIAGLRRVADLAGWPRVTGIVKGLDLYHESSIRAGEKTPVNTWEPRVTYEYRVGDHVYTNDVVSFIPPVHTDREAARALLHEWDSGQEVPVYYNPKNPEEAVLRTEIDRRKPMILTVSGLLATLIGAVGLAIGLGGIAP